MDLKQYPTKAYSFGVSRGEAKKLHLYEIFKKGEDGNVIPGPGQYSPKSPLGTDSPLYSIMHRHSMVESKCRYSDAFLGSLDRCKFLPGPGTYKHPEVLGPLKP